MRLTLPQIGFLISLAIYCAVIPCHMTWLWFRSWRRTGIATDANFAIMLLVVSVIGICMVLIAAGMFGIIDLDIDEVRDAANAFGWFSITAIDTPCMLITYRPFRRWRICRRWPWVKRRPKEVKMDHQLNQSNQLQPLSIAEFQAWLDQYKDDPRWGEMLDALRRADAETVRNLSTKMLGWAGWFVPPPAVEENKDNVDE